MNTKKVWLAALVTGMIAAVLIYSAFVTNITSPEEEAQIAEEQAAMEEREAEAEFERNKVNPIVEIEEGKRAVSLRVTHTEEGVSGYIEPKSKVDIVAYQTEIEEEQEEDSEDISETEFLTAELILQDVKVLASGASADSENEALRYETVTVEVTPEEGVLLSLAAKDQDGFYFLLRNDEDGSVEEDEISLTRQVMKGERQ
jgi:Flp pilus assembly protein CpaB